MNDQRPTTRTMKITDVKRQLSRLTNDVARQQMRVLIEKDGIPVAALVSAADLEWLAQHDRNMAELSALIERARESFKDVPPEEIEAETDRIIARNRAAARALAATG